MRKRENTCVCARAIFGVYWAYWAWGEDHMRRMSTHIIGKRGEDKSWEGG